MNNMEIRKLGEKTYVIENPVNVGIYLINDNEVCLIDTGSSKDYGKNIAKILEENNWTLKYIVNTHSHADHIGGNSYLQEKYHALIYAEKTESYFINNPLLEPALMYGAKPLESLCTSFLMAKPSNCEDIKNMNIEGLEIVDLKGHSFGLIGIATSDNVLFVGDAYTSPRILNKYAIQYTYDVEEFLKTLDYLETTNYDYYVPSHGEIEKDIKGTLNINRQTTLTIEKEILDILEYKHFYNDILNELFINNHIKSSIEQYHIIGTTVKSFLTKLVKEDKIEIMAKDGNLWINKK